MKAFKLIVIGVGLGWFLGAATVTYFPEATHGGSVHRCTR